MSGEGTPLALDARYIVRLGEDAALHEVWVVEFSPSRGCVKLRWADNDVWRWYAVSDVNLIEALPQGKDG